MIGIINGGLNFLAVGYILTWGVLIVYAISLIVRTRRCRKDLEDGEI